MRRKHEWTDKHVETLKTMWADGATAQEIADRIGGITRCSVLGKAHRLKLPLRDLHIALSLANRSRLRKERAKGIVRQMPGKTLKCNPENARRRPLTGRTPPVAITLAKDFDPAALTPFTALEEGMCRFMPGEINQGACGCPVVPNSSWCPEHHRIVFNRIEVVRRRHYEIRQPTFYELEVEKA